MRQTVSIFGLVFLLVILSCTGDMPPEPVRDNPLDENNPETGGNPFELQAEIAGGGILLTWETVSVASVDGYHIYRKVDESEYSLLTNIEDKDISNFTDTDIQNAHTYYYYIVAYNTAGDIVTSNMEILEIHSAPLLSIDDQEGYTTTRQVNLTLLAPDAVFVQIGAADLSGAQWMDYSTTKTIELESGSGTKIVDARFIYSNGDTSVVVSDSTLPMPMSPSMFINSDSSYTAARMVVLNLSATGALWVRITNDSSSATPGKNPEIIKISGVLKNDEIKLTSANNDDWIPYAETLTWQLSTGAGEKRVYVDFKNDFDIIETASDAIEPLPMESGFSINHNSAYTAARVVWLFPQAEGVSLQCKFSEDSAFAGVSWQPLADSTSFSLSTGEGDKVVYARIRNDFLIESPLLADTISPLPMNPSFNIAHNAVYTATKEVWLFPSASGVNLECIFSEDSVFTGVSWQPLADSTSFSLSTGEGDKVVYARIRNDLLIESSLLSDEISPLPMNPSFSIAHDASFTATKEVWLFPSASGVNLECIFSEDNAFSGVSWQSLDDSISFTLSGGPDTKTVYARFKNDFLIESSLLSQIINPSSLYPVLKILPDSTYINHNQVDLSMPNVGALQMQLSVQDDSSAFDWQTYSEYVEDFALEAGDGLKHVYAWFRHDFFSAGPVIDSMWVDTDCAIDTFYWTSDGGDTLTAGDVLDFHLVMQEDNIGAEIGGTATLTLEGVFENLVLADNSDGTYYSQYTVNSTDYCLEGIVSANFTDRAGNITDPFSACELVTIIVAWEKIFDGNGDDYGYCVQNTSDGGYIIAGQTFGSGAGEAWLIKTDAEGNEQWNQAFDGGGEDAAHCVQQTSDGGYILTGYSYNSGSLDVLLIKTNSTGVEEWSETFGDIFTDKGFSVKKTSDGGYIIAGYTNSYGAGNSDMWLIKTDADGNEQWNRTFGGANWEIGNDVEQTDDGGYIIAGKTGSATSGYVRLVKTDSEGIETWHENYMGSITSEGFAVQQTFDGGYIVTGYTYTDYPAGSIDVCLIKTDSEGNEQWPPQTYGGIDNDYGYDVVQTEDGGYMIVGVIGGDACVIKTDANGGEVWTKLYGGLAYDEGRSIRYTPDGGFILAGSSQSFGAGDSDVYLIKDRAE